LNPPLSYRQPSFPAIFHLDAQIPPAFVESASYFFTVVTFNRLPILTTARRAAD
jgi:hypothetical protein